MTIQSQSVLKQESLPTIPEESSPEWMADTEASLQQLLALPENWNSYGARTIRPEIARSALDLLQNVAPVGTPQPIVVPTTHGGIQLEWHTSGIDLEIEFQSPTQLRVFYENTEDGEVELELNPTDLPRIADLIARLAPPRSEQLP